MRKVLKTTEDVWVTTATDTNSVRIKIGIGFEAVLCRMPACATEQIEHS